MARLARLTVAGHPHHILQRGNNRQAIFATVSDRERMLALLAESARSFDVDVHAYVLMDNHFHLLATPKSAESLSQMMQTLGRRYVRHFNAAHGRSGTLWEGRYRSSLLEAERFLLACMVYFDLNPVRHGVVSQAQDYAWSSYGHYSGQRNDRFLTAHPLLWQLGNTPFDRESRYRELVLSGVSAEIERGLTQSVIGGWALGSVDFVARLQKSVARRLSRARAGRPPHKHAAAGARSIEK
ncbi:MAG: transposase [Burkholderiaceae bacterium]